MNPYINPQTVRATLRQLGVRPSRDMGQNFLLDGDALAQIVAAAELRADDDVVEVGPGVGALTWELVRRARRVTAVELDKRLVERLRAEFADAPQLTLIQGNALTIAPETLAAPPYKLVANIPYSITSPLLRHFLEAIAPPSLMVLLVQWEVARRIAAAPGDLSILAHAVQLRAIPEVIARVPAASFEPVPSVDSAILRLRVRPAPAAPDPEALMQLIKAGFLHPRKQLGNAFPAGIAALHLPYTKEQALAALHAAGVAAQRRAETVTLDEWERVRRAL